MLYIYNIIYCILYIIYHILYIIYYTYIYITFPNMDPLFGGPISQDPAARSPPAHTSRTSPRVQSIRINGRNIQSLVLVTPKTIESSVIAVLKGPFCLVNIPIRCIGSKD